ncbi:CHASE domain-containing protein [Deefgea piscis]|uniref:Sensory/regulatory protein RpfC n=1 Tax=Deefgea piscis TaxID=2739061 RepID=A0A6M8SRH1_9NEIS|nr:CHASE domain-containing protein [Deefgea piscis]QKJ65906.1 CHASE domain-containing protein [Deefgea piscis]
MRHPFAFLPAYLPSCLFGLLYFVVAKYSLHLAFAATSVSPIWPPAGIAVAGIILIGYRSIPFLVIAAFAANLANLWAQNLPINSQSILVCAAIGVGNTLEALVGAILIERWIGHAQLLARFQNVFRLVLIALLAALCSALIGCLSLIWGGVLPAAAWMNVFSTWWMGDVCGILVMTPLILCCWSAALERKPFPKLSMIIAFFATLALLLAIVFAPFFAQSSPLLLLLLLPPIAWAAWHDQGRGVTSCVFVVVSVAIWATLQGRGPFAAQDLNSALISLDSFVAVWCVIGLALAADLNERQQLALSHRVEAKDLMPWLVLLIGIALTITAWDQAQKSRREQNQLQFNRQAHELAERINERIKIYEHILLSVNGLFAIKDITSPEEWHQYIEHLFIQQRLPGVQGISYAAYLRGAAQKSQFEKTQQKIRPNFQIQPAGEREIYTPVTYLEPGNWRNQRAIGFDLYSETVRRRAIELARDTGQPTLTGKIKLRQETQQDQQNGSILMVPLFQRAMPTSTVAQRQAAFRGVIASPFRMKDWTLATLGQGLQQFNIQLFDGVSTNPKALMFANQTIPALGDSDLRQQVFTLNLPNHQWTLQLAPSKAFVAAVGYQNERNILMGGLLVSVLLFALLRTLLLSNHKAMRLAKTMAASLRESEAKFSSLVDTAGEAIIVTDASGRILSFNASAEKLFAYGKEEILGENLLILISPADRAIYQAMFAANARVGSEIGFAHQAELLALHRQGDEFPIVCSLSAWEFNGAVYFGAIIMDLTARKQIENELSEALHVAELANQAKSAFLANMSHEIRTPLNAILGFSSLLADTELNRQQHEFLAAIHSGGDLLLCQINDLLDFSKIEAGKLEIEQIDFDVRCTLEDSFDLVSAKAAEKNLAMACLIDPSTPWRLRGDPARIRQIMLNLLNNAIKFTAQGEVLARVHAEQVNERQYRLYIAISDTGVGIAPEVQLKLFQPFTQADSSTTRQFGGTGLGLSICKRLCEIMGGQIEVKSQLGAGAIFSFNLLLDVAERDGGQPSLAPIIQGRRVLLLEHVAINRELLSLQLQSMGLVVEVFADEAAVLARVATQSDFIVAILDNLDLGRAIRQLDSSLPLVLLTAVSQQGQAALAKEIGFAAFLSKPIRTAQLHACLNEVLNLQQRPEDERALVTVHHIAEMQHKTYVLLAEDNQINQKIAVLMLEKIGCRVDVVADGREALNAVQQNNYDLLFMDCQMPEMDGFAATEAIRALDNEKRSIPIVALTANAFAEDVRHCYAVGMNDFLSKPVKIEDLKKIVEKWGMKPSPA